MKRVTTFKTKTIEITPIEEVKPEVKVEEVKPEEPEVEEEFTWNIPGIVFLLTVLSVAVIGFMYIPEIPRSPEIFLESHFDEFANKISDVLYISESWIVKIEYFIQDVMSVGDILYDF